MKISIDLDGTLYDHSEFFRTLMRVMQADGHEVGILTGHRHGDAERDFDKIVKAGFPQPNFYFGRTPDDMPYNGAVAKSRYILGEGIDYHYDDCDYGLPSTVELFRLCLKEQHYRLIVMQFKEPILHGNEKRIR